MKAYGSRKHCGSTPTWVPDDDKHSRGRETARARAEIEMQVEDLEVAFLTAFTDCETCGGWGVVREEAETTVFEASGRRMARRTLSMKPCKACLARIDAGEIPMD